ncbi:MAG TPA: T9SS type A sorting domain-containing protein [Flavobacteriales bacterium]|jgi:hypothetical protein|nr:T9SS type A sorting domain-containing protein [Flavobacteriales bacterium]HQW97309.1 T9SS type A sorting domain-containing protein [Flavobacteriales bacterium]HQY00514.1 T9SS type A sorting domain-containing protein [Flavobacteriales bacterium]
MKNSLLILAFTCSVGYSHGQQTFAHLYDGVTSFMYNLTELEGGNLFVGLGRTRAVTRLDAQGFVIGTHSYWADQTSPLTGLGAIRRYADNEYLFTGGARGDTCADPGTNSTLSFSPVLGKMDSMGNVIELHQYVLNDGCQNTCGDVSVTSDGGAVTWGYRSDFFAFKVDAAMMPVWARHFANNGGFQFIKELPSGDLLAGINMDTAGAVVARMDANGEFLWCKSYIRPKGMIHDAVILSDDDFIITGYTDSINISLFDPLPGTFQPKLFMMKLDGMGEVQWCRGFASNTNRWYTRQWSRIQPTLDGNFVLLATLGQPNSNFFYRPFLMKTDQNGDSLWTRSMAADNYALRTRDLIAHSDGGFAFTGSVWGTLPDLNSSLAFVFKTDNEGYLSCVERPYPVQIVDLFPTDSSFVLTSVDGATRSPAYLNDSIFDPFAVYDACEIILNTVTYTFSTKMRVYPNPTTGHFTVQFQDPLQAESYYSVYDTMGKLLFQRRLPTGATQEEMDLTGFSPGTYVLRFTDRDGVCYERVVLE